MEDVLKQLAGGRVGVERRRPTEQLVQQNADRVEVRPDVDFVAASLFRRHVLGGAHHVIVVGVVRGGDGAGEAEVGQHRLPVHPIDHDVAGLDVAMDQPLAMSCSQTLEHLIDDGESFFARQLRRAMQPLGKRFALNKLHRIKVSARVLADKKNRHDVRVSQPRGGAGFRLKLLDEVRIATETRRENFDGDGPVERPVKRRDKQCPFRRARSRRRCQSVPADGMAAGGQQFRRTM